MEAIFCHSMFWSHDCHASPVRTAWHVDLAVFGIRPCMNPTATLHETQLIDPLRSNGSCPHLPIESATPARTTFHVKPAHRARQDSSTKPLCEKPERKPVRKAGAHGPSAVSECKARVRGPDARPVCKARAKAGAQWPSARPRARRGPKHAERSTDAFSESRSQRSSNPPSPQRRQNENGRNRRMCAILWQRCTLVRA